MGDTVTLQRKRYEVIILNKLSAIIVDPSNGLKAGSAVVLRRKHMFNMKWVQVLKMSYSLFLKVNNEVMMIIRMTMVPVCICEA